MPEAWRGIAKGLGLAAIAAWGSGSSPADAARAPGECLPIVAGAPVGDIDCDCAIDVDPEALRQGWVQVRFLWGASRLDRRQLGCTAQGLGGGRIELIHEGAVIHSVDTAPVAKVAPPFFSHSIRLADRYRTSSGSFTVRARHGAWSSNDVEFVLPPR